MGETETASAGDEGLEDDYALDKSLVTDVLLALASGNHDRLEELFEPLHPADIADLLEQLGEGQRRELLLFAGPLIDGEVLSEIEDDVRESVIDILPDDQLAEAVRELESDDVVDIIEDLDEPQQEAILDALDQSDRMAVEQALSYPEFSAGRLMQREVVTAPEHWTVGDAITHLRAQEELPEQFYHVI
ncbi:MAG: magnesium transporter, partial [Silicimonas sp.]|nr:magnesium transporter [Silicimonas sp.]